MPALQSVLGMCKEVSDETAASLLRSFDGTRFAVLAMEGGGGGSTALSSGGDEGGSSSSGTASAGQVGHKGLGIKRPHCICL